MRPRSEDRTSVDKANRVLMWLLWGWGVGNVAVWWIHLARRSSREVQVSLVAQAPSVNAPGLIWEASSPTARWHPSSQS